MCVEARSPLLVRRMLRRTAQPPTLRRHADLPVARGHLREPPPLDVRRRPARWLRPVDLVLRHSATRGPDFWSHHRVSVLCRRDDVCRSVVCHSLLVASAGS